MFSVNQCGCGCSQAVAPTPQSPNRCRKTINSDDLGALIYLMGLDADNCEKLQKVVDVFSLRDCAGNVIASTTPIVTCADFRAQLCAAIALLPDNGEATETTKFVGADCKLYTLPQGVVPEETPNTASDTSTIDMSATGTLGRNISGVVKVSDDTGNILEVHSDGLFVPEGDAPLSACAQIQSFPTGSDAVEGTVLIGADCEKHVLSFPDALTVTDTSSVDLTLVGSNLQAAVKLDPSGLNILLITGSGLYLACSTILACAPPVTVVDTNSVNLTITGQQLQADVIVSPAPGNALSITGAGLYVDVCSALDDGNLPVPAVVGATVLVGADCNRYTIPETSINVIDTSTVNLTASGSFNHTLQADVKVQPNTLLEIGPQGLQVTCEAAQDCIFNTTNNFWAYDDGSNAVAFNPSADAGNQITNGTDGRPFVPSSEPTVADTDCIHLEINSGEITAEPIISLVSGNILQCLGDGLYANVSPLPIEINGDSTPCINVAVNEPTTDNFVITAAPVISPDGGNTLECRANGLFAAGTVGNIIGQDTDCIDITVVESPTDTFTISVDPIISPDTGNLLVCQANGLFAALPCTPDPVSEVGAGTIDLAADRANGINVYVVDANGGSITLTNPPDAACEEKHLYIKNVDTAALSVISADLIDGQGTITLQGTSTGGYPFGNDGGEAVHLIWRSVANTWAVF